MKRDALVVGINQYPFLKDKPENEALHLQTPAADAEAIAHLLESYGDFEVHRLPAKQGVKQVDRKKLLKTADLQAAIRQLFCPQGNSIPETALLFFAGHGLRKNQNGETEGFLATSEASPRKNLWGISLKWLRQLLQESPVRQQIIWLDCCHSGELLNFTEAELGEFQKGRDRCLIVASRDFQVAYGDGEHGMLTNALLQSLDPANRPDGWVTNFTLVDRVRELLKAAPQHPVCTNTGGQIILTGKQGVLANICPYKGLAYFDWNEEDPKYFYGRTRLTNLLLEKVRSGNFLAVLGASGSGKSSVVRAGLLYHLQLGEAIPGSERWKIYPPFTPGDRPLQRLKEVVGVEAEQLEPLIKAAAAERVVLVVDQFEEVFSQCRDDRERQQFFNCLLEALERTENKLCLVLVMRSDFQGQCDEYPELATKIDSNPIRVMQMSQEELKEAITKPAEKVGLEIERELVTQMIADVEGSPGDLPLLQYALTELWEQKGTNRLTVSDYTQIGGVKQALEKQANKIYESFSPQEQQVAKQIFLALTQMNEGIQDTRRRVRKQDLITHQQSETIVELVIARLTEAKLLIADKLENENERVPVIDIAHEALIRHWQLLRDWLKENREAVIIKQDIEDAAQAWRDNQKPNELGYLLQGTRLAAAEDYLQRYGESVPLSIVAQEYVQVSQAERDRLSKEEEERKHREQEQLRRAIEGEIQALVSLSEARFLLNDQLGALLASMRAGIQLKQATWVEESFFIQAIIKIQQAVYKIQECNRFQGHNHLVNAVSFNPDGKLIASASYDKTVKLWSHDGTLLKTLENNYVVECVSFSPDGKSIVFGSDDGTVTLWNFDKREFKNFKVHSSSVYSVTFSPDSQIIASASSDTTVKFWNLNSRESKILNHNSSVYSVSFSPDSKIIATASSGMVYLWGLDGIILKTFNIDIGEFAKANFSSDGQIIAVINGRDSTIQIWDTNGNLLKTLNQNAGSDPSQAIISISFSPDSKTIAAATGAGDTSVKLWSIEEDEQLLMTFPRHTYAVNDVSFSPNGKSIVTGAGKTIRLWSSNYINVLKISSWVLSLRFSPDGRTIATVNRDLNNGSTILQLWNVDGRLEKKFKIPVSGDEKTKFSHSCKTLAIPSGKNILLWNWNTGRCRSLRGHKDVVVSVSFRFDGKMLASASRDNTVIIWNLEKKLFTIIPHINWVFNVIFSPDGETIATISDKIHIWNLKGELIKILNENSDGSTVVCFSPDSKIIAVSDSSNDGTVNLWHLENGSIKHLTPKEKIPSAGVKSIRFRPDGRIIVTAFEGLNFWNLDGSLLGTINGHGSDILDISFSPDGKTIAIVEGYMPGVGNLNYIPFVSLWSFELDSLLLKGCTWLRDYLKNSSQVSDRDKCLCHGINNFIV